MPKSDRFSFIKKTIGLLLGLIAIVLLSSSANGQNKKQHEIDSIKRLLKNNNSEEKETKLLCNIAWRFRTINSDSSVYYANLAIEKNNGKQTVGLFSAYITLGTIEQQNAKYFSTIDYYKKAELVANNIGSKRAISIICNNLGTIYQFVGDYEESIEYNYKSLGIKEANGDTIGTISSLINIASLYYDLDKIDEGVETAQRALKLAEGKFPDKVLLILNSLGAFYKETGDFDEANYVFQNAYNLAIEQQDTVMIATTMHNIGSNYDTWGKYALSKKYYSEALVLKKSIGNERSLVKTQFGIAILDFNMGDYQSAIVKLEKLNEFYVKSGLINDLEISYGYLAKAYFEKGLFEEAYKTQVLFHEINDSIKSEEKANFIELTEIKYQTQQKENEILKLTNENIIQEARLAQSKYTIYGIIGLLILIVGFGYFIGSKQKQKQKLAVLESAVKASETEKNRIGRELHDGIAGRILKIVYETDGNQIGLSDKLLQTYNEVRGLSHQLDGRSMHGELFFDRLMEAIPENKDGQRIDVHLSPKNLELQEPCGTHVYRIVQELMSNNLKHAKASKTEINIQLENNVLSVLYADNGIGVSNFKKGNGFNNMEDRIELMNGEITLNTAQDKGFEIAIKIPSPETTMSYGDKLAV